MPKIRIIDRAALRLIRDAINENLAEFAKENGIAIQAGRATYAHDGSTATFKVEILTQGNNGV